MSAILQSQVTITTETFSDELLSEILPLGQKCWKESTIAKGETCAFYGERDFEIEPDVEQYRKLSEMGSLVIVTLRDSGTVQGYVSGFLYRGLHHRKILGCIGDTIYAEPDYRVYIGVLVDKFLNEMRAKKAQIVGWPTTPDGPVYHVLKARGFVGDDIVMEKRLCA